MKRTLKDYITVLVGTGFSRGIAFLNSVIVARLLGPEDFGKFSIFFVAMVLTWLIPQAFDSTFVRYAKTAGSSAEKNEFLKISVFLKLVYSAVVLIAAYPLAFFLAGYCFHKPEVKMILVWAMVSGVFQSFLMTIASIFQEKERFTMFSFLYSFYTLSIFAVLMLIKMLASNFALTHVIMAHAAVSIIIGALSLFLLFKRRITALFPLDRKSLTTSFSLGKWILGTTILYYIFQRMDILFLTRYSNFAALGVYGAAQQIVMVISVMTGSVPGVFLPKACNALESKEAFRIFAKESLLIAGLINIPVIVLMIIAPAAIKVLYGNTYGVAGGITRILLAGWIGVIIYAPFGGLFYALNDSKTRFWLEASRFLIAAVLFHILIPSNGMTGAAWAMSITLIINSVISLWVLKNKITCKFSGYV